VSWTVDDPGQGDRAVIAALAADLQAQADDAASGSRQLRSLHDNTTDALWRGQAADAFRHRVAKVPAHLDKLHASYAEAAAGMRAYAAAVSQIADDAAAARQRVTSAKADQQSAAAAQAGWVAPLSPATGHPEPAAVNPHDEAVAAANSAVGQANAVLDDLADQRTAVDHRAIAALRQAHHAGMKNKPWWRSALAVVSAALADITVVLILVAIVAIIVLAFVQPELIPGLLLLSGQVLTGLSAAQLAVDGTRKAAGDDVSWGSLAMDALGALPALGAFTDLTKLADLTRVTALGEKATAVAGRLADAASTAAAALRDTAAAFRVAARSVITDIKGFRIVVRVLETTIGARILTVERDGKYLGQMLTDAKDAAAREPVASPNQLNRAIRRGQAPEGIIRIDTPKVPHEQLHATFDDGSALNIDGTWKHGGLTITKRQAEWLVTNGWKLP
jgi:hypothetical protein